ncbi:hypothetical protein LOTGIDRAFT_163653 [Lottia gigantea]|uniref:Uncharacterized protein n=1 Tax=Lottia gigantea TaxID=225164 RepID=V4ABT2_LOTGI|nr:hypothetical protein LOTGIDRAFT_163653 [Lottia gigantea]ESO90771.1 hypothetical protein LOTGIDRAFT_163653 [Lottia gigantea]
MGKKFNHSEIFPNNPMLMCICGSSGSGKTHLTFNMLTTPNLLDFDSLYIYTATPGQSYYQFLKALEYLPKKDVQDIFQYYEENEEEMEIKDIIDNFIKAKNPSFNPTDIKVFLTKNVNDLDLSKIDSERKNLMLFDDCVAQRNQAVQHEFFTKGRHHNCHCIYQSQSFNGVDSMFIRKNANCFLLFELNDKDLSQIVQSINHRMDRDAFKKELGDYAEDNNSITKEIDEFEDMVSGEGITFLSDNNEELLNRLRVILAAMKEGHRSHRQYNEVNCILKRLLEKVS